MDTPPPADNAAYLRIKQALENAADADIARRLNVTPQAVSQWKSGSTKPDAYKLIRVAEISSYPLEWLLTGDERFLASKLNKQHGSSRPLDSLSETAIYFGEAEREIIEGLAAESGRTFDEEVRELVLETLFSRGLMTEQVETANLIFFGESVPKLVPMKLLGEIAAGEPLDVFEFEDTVLIAEEFVTAGRNNFVLRVRGESMIDEGILDGDLIICYESSDANNGDTVVALIDGERATVKKFYRERNRIRLQPKNKGHRPITLDSHRVKVQGVVIGIQRRT